MNSLKWSLTRFYSTKRRIDSLPKNHYDVLQITPRATQSEVKSAYYKLTLRYHPDKNNNEYAKQKFQDISDAYEVLGNHELRRNYDRSVMIGRGSMPNVEQSSTTSNVEHRERVYTGNTKIYNFDEWVNAHYSKQIDAARNRRKAYEHMKIMEELRNRDQRVPVYFDLALFLVALIIISLTLREQPDVPSPESKKHVKR